MKGLVIYYSGKGSNRYLARKTAEASGFEMEEIRPRIGGMIPLMLASLTGFGGGIRKIRKDVASFDQLIICGPIWAGHMAYPLKAFITKYKTRIKKLHFVTCCGSGDDQKDDKYGYESVFTTMAGMLDGTFAGGFTVPVSLLAPGGKPEEMLKIRLTDDNFGLVRERFEAGMAGILKG